MGVAFLRGNKRRKKKNPMGKLLVTFAATAGSNTLHLYSGAEMFSCDIDWGDGEVTACPPNGGQIVHNYAVGATYVIKIVGTKFGGFHVNGSTGCTKYLKIDMDKSLGGFEECVNATDFRSCFSRCSSLTTIPTGLFDNCVNVTSFYACFTWCTSLTSIPAGLFDSCVNVTDFRYCFAENTKITNNVPTLWLRTNPTPNGGWCYGGCTKATNYTEIPTGWR